MAFAINNPNELSDQEWAKLVNEYKFVKELEYKNLEHVFKSALSEVLSKMFQK